MTESSIYNSIITLNIAIGQKGLFTLSRTVDWNENGESQRGTLTLWMGRGYFSGSLLSIKNEKINRMIDRPIEGNARKFVDGIPPGVDESLSNPPSDWLHLAY